jgi:hypothetical protein
MVYAYQLTYKDNIYILPSEKARSIINRMKVDKKAIKGEGIFTNVDNIMTDEEIEAFLSGLNN